MYLIMGSLCDFIIKVIHSIIHKTGKKNRKQKNYLITYGSLPTTFYLFLFIDSNAYEDKEYNRYIEHRLRTPLHKLKKKLSFFQI